MKRPERLLWVVVSCALMGLAAELWAAEPARVRETPQTLYVLHCSGCHGRDGAGDLSADVPPLPGYVDALLSDPQGRLYVTNVGGVMSSGLDDQGVADVLNWIIDQFAAPEPAIDSKSGNEISAERSKRTAIKLFDAAEVHALRERRPADIVALRREIAERSKKQGVELLYPWP